MANKSNPMKLAILGMTENQVVEQAKSALHSTNKNKRDNAENVHTKYSRDNKRHIGGFFEPLVAKQLKILAAESELSIQSLLQEALNDLFNKYGKSSVA